MKIAMFISIIIVMLGIVVFSSGEYPDPVPMPGPMPTPIIR